MEISTAFPKTISQFIKRQLPAYVRENDPLFVSFLEAYYRWLELNGVVVYSGTILSASVSGCVISAPASTEFNDYQNSTIVIANGSLKGFHRKISGFDPTTNAISLSNSWGLQLPLPNTSVQIKKGSSPAQFLNYSNIDATLPVFLPYFQNTFLPGFPVATKAKTQSLVKYSKAFYSAKGTEDSFKFLFKSVFDANVTVYYPKVDLFKPSSAKWIVDSFIRTTSNCDTFDWVNRQITGSISGATASVESVQQCSFLLHDFEQGSEFGQDEFADQQILPVMTELKVSDVIGSFVPEDDIQVSYNVLPPPQSDLGSDQDLLLPKKHLYAEKPFLIVNGFNIVNPGIDYVVGDEVNVSGDGYRDCIAYVSGVTNTRFNGQFSSVTANQSDSIGGNQIGGSTIGGDNIQTVPYLYTLTTALTTNMPGDLISIVDGFGRGQARTIVQYFPTTNQITLDSEFLPLPDNTSKFVVTHNKGGILQISISDPGFGFINQTNTNIVSQTGTGASVTALIGVVSSSGGRWGSNYFSGVYPALPDGFTDSDKIIQDSLYWQDYSYDIQFKQPLADYQTLVKNLLHPAGFRMFGSIFVDESSEPSQIVPSVNEISDIPNVLNVSDIGEIAVYTYVEGDNLTVLYDSSPSQSNPASFNTSGPLPAYIPAGMQFENIADPGDEVGIPFTMPIEMSGDNTSSASLGNSLIGSSSLGEDTSQNQPPIQFVNASTVPVFMDYCTVVVIGQVQTLDVSQTLADSVFVSNQNGHSFHILSGGGLLFRTQYNGVTISATLPSGSLSVSDWFMASFRFNQGELTGGIAVLRATSYASSYTTSSFDSFSPFHVVSTGWTLVRSTGLPVIVSLQDTMASFSGILAYSMFYDRALYNYELDDIYFYTRDVLIRRGVQIVDLPPTSVITDNGTEASDNEVGDNEVS